MSKNVKKAQTAREDAHLDKPELGDTVEFKARGEYTDISTLGTITRVSAKTVEVETYDGDKYRAIAQTDVIVIRKAG